MSESKSSLVNALALVLSMANSHIEDIESGLEDGTYEASENLDIDEKNAAVQRIQSLHDKLCGIEAPSVPALPKDFVDSVFIDRPRG